MFGVSYELSLAILDDSDPAATANVVLLAAAWELCQRSSALAGAALASLPERSGTVSDKLKEECNRTLALLSSIASDIKKSTTQRYGEEERDE